MADVRFRVEGVTELARSLDALANDIEGDLGGVYQDLAERGVKAVSSFAPRRSGRLAGSFAAKGGKGQAEVSSDLIYAGPIDGGWRKHNIAPAHYTRRAAEQLAEQAPAVLDAAIAQAIREKGLQ